MSELPEAGLRVLFERDQSIDRTEIQSFETLPASDRSRNFLPMNCVFRTCLILERRPSEAASNIGEQATVRCVKVV